MCDSKELLVGYVYDELSVEERRAMQAHLAGCGACRLELEGLRATRTHLTLWSPPVPDLGFRVIQGGSAPAPALPRRMRLAPAFAFAAAAVIVLAVAAAIANVEVRYANDGVTVRTGWARTETASANPPAAASNAVTGSAVPAAGGDAFAELDLRLRSLEASLAAQPADSGLQRANSTMTGMTNAETMRRVRQIVSEAEARQQTAVARQLLQVMRDLEQQRRADFAVLQQGLEHYQGMTNAELAQNRDMFTQYVRAAARQEK
jgi:hypothetical protein